MFLNSIKFKETEFHKLNEENKQVSLLKGSGFRVKNDNFKIVLLLLYFLLIPSVGDI